MKKRQRIAFEANDARLIADALAASTLVADKDRIIKRINRWLASTPVTNTLK